MLWVARRAFTTAGGSIQKAKMQAMLSVQSLWDHSFFSNQMTRQQPTAQAQSNLATFFRQTERFKLLEQGISCFPIFISMGQLPLEVVGSTGQIQSQTIHAMVEQGVSTLLLDEWDANLDQVNATRLDGQIDELSQRALVIEVRHSRAR